MSPASSGRNMGFDRSCEQSMKPTSSCCSGRRPRKPPTRSSAEWRHALATKPSESIMPIALKRPCHRRRRSWRTFTSRRAWRTSADCRPPAAPSALWWATHIPKRNRDVLDQQASGTGASGDALRMRAKPRSAPTGSDAGLGSEELPNNSTASAVRGASCGSPTRRNRSRIASILISPSPNITAD